MNAGLAALLAVLACQAAAGIIAAILAAADRLRVTVTIGRPRGARPKTGEQA
jgi:hypothetical protein